MSLATAYVASMVPISPGGAGFPPPGRVRMNWDEAHTALVANPAFGASTTRADLWDQLASYLTQFAEVIETNRRDVVGDGLIHHLWLGGSFVSTKVDPQNIDVAVCIDDDVRERFKGRPGSKFLREHAFNRTKVSHQFKGLSPVEIPYTQVASVFQRGMLGARELGYLQARGAWDDWWQRCRDHSAPSGAPSAATTPARRGYLEVVL